MPTTSKGLRYPANSDGPQGPLQIQQLASDVDNALPGPWVDLVRSLSNYNAAPPTSWGEIPDYFGRNVTVPNGRTLEVEFKAPRINVGASSQVSARLMIGANYVDSGDVIKGTSVTGADRMILTGSAVGTGATLLVYVTFLRSGDGFVQGNGITGPVLRYRIV